MTVFVQRCTWVCSLFLATIREPLLALHIFNCCVSSVKKYRLGIWNCHDHDIFALNWPDCRILSEVQRNVVAVSVKCDGLGCHVVCLRSSVNMWLYSCTWRVTASNRSVLSKFDLTWSKLAGAHPNPIHPRIDQNMRSTWMCDNEVLPECSFYQAVSPHRNPNWKYNLFLSKTPKVKGCYNGRCHQTQKAYIAYNMKYWWCLQSPHSQGTCKIVCKTRTEYWCLNTNLYLALLTGSLEFSGYAEFQ